MKKAVLILVAFLIGVTIFCVFKYIASINALNKLRTQYMALELEKQNLLKDIEKEKEIQKALTTKNLLLKNNLKASVNKLHERSLYLEAAKEKIKQLSSQMSLLKAENRSLRKRKNDLYAQLEEVSLEKENLEARLNSITELRKAIRELKRQMRKVGGEIQEKARLQKKGQGNEGFVVKEGKTSYPAPKVRIEVSPAEANP